MRFLVAAVAGSVALASWSPAQAQCAQAREVTAFNVRALQSQLMVGALVCDMVEDYNRVILKHRTELDGSRRTLISYFTRAGGGARAFNEYDTELANVQSTVSTRRGSLYCGEIKPVFTEVLGLPNAAEVGKYAAAKSLPQPRQVNPCPSAPAAAAAPRR